MKKASIVIASTLMLSSPLSAFANETSTSPLNINGTEESLSSGTEAPSLLAEPSYVSPPTELTDDPGVVNIQEERVSPPDTLADEPTDPIYDTVVPDYQTLPESQVLYSGPIGGDETATTKPVYGISTVDGTSKVIVSDGARFTWDYETTTYGSDRLVKDGYSWLTTILMGAASGFAGYGITALFAAPKNAAIAGGIAGSLWSKGTSYLPTTQYTYWTVKRYVDKDAYNLYKKYVIYVYKDSGRTKLHRSFTEVHSNRYR